MPFDDDQRRLPGGRGSGERAINLPPAVLWLIGINVAVQVFAPLLGEQVDQEIILRFGLAPAAYTTDSGQVSCRAGGTGHYSVFSMAGGCISASTC